MEGDGAGADAATGTDCPVTPLTAFVVERVVDI